jgi:ribosome-associated protein
MALRLEQRDEELLAQCDVETYCSSGPGGQNVNRRSTAVRLRHRPTGLMVVCQRERSQWSNKLLALEDLRGKLERRDRRRRTRIPTAKTYGAKMRGLDEKKHQGQKKAERKKPDIDE